MSRSDANCFQNSGTGWSVPLWFAPLRGRLYRRCTFMIAIVNHPRDSCRWWVPVRGEDGRESHNGAPASKVPGTDVLIKALVRTRLFLVATNQTSAPLDRAAPFAAGPRLSSSLLMSSSTPMDGHARSHERWATSNELHSMAPLPGCPPRTPTPASRR
jgi:hypothetical protein